MSKYTTIPFFVAGEDEPRLALMLPENGVEIAPSPYWFVPVAQLVDANGASGLTDNDGNDVPDDEYGWALVASGITLDEM